MIVAPLPDDIDTVPFVPAERAAVDLQAIYFVITNDGVLESWPGSLVYARLRPEFQIGRPVEMAKVTV